MKYRPVDRFLESGMAMNWKEIAAYMEERTTLSPHEALLYVGRQNNVDDRVIADELNVSMDELERYTTDVHPRVSEDKAAEIEFFGGVFLPTSFRREIGSFSSPSTPERMRLNTLEDDAELGSIEVKIFADINPMNMSPISVFEKFRIRVQPENGPEISEVRERYYSYDSFEEFNEESVYAPKQMSDDELEFHASGGLYT